MTPEAQDLWNRALQTMETARKLVADDPDSAASRAYYAAFHGVAALFAVEGKSFRKHTAIEAAVHRDLVNTGRCSEEFGIALFETRQAALHGRLRFPGTRFGGGSDGRGFEGGIHPRCA